MAYPTLQAAHQIQQLGATQITYGGDYNPEQWPEHVWHEDARLMQQAGVNLVSLGIFAWARLEPQPDVYDFGWLDTVMDVLYEHGVCVNLGTGTPAPPPWFSKLHPESLPVTAEGIVLAPGTRRHYSPHSRAYRAHAARFVTRLAEHYRQHPALAMWHIDNEYSCHVAECFGPEADAAYQNWLERRYKSLDALNDAWGSAFWGQVYGAWDEIAPPRRAPYMHNPANTLDWKRFSSDAWLACFEDQRAILKRITPDIPITTNFMGFNKPLDYWQWAAREDVVSNDSYPEPSDPDSPVMAAMECDLMRSLGGGKPWILMEQATSHVNWRTRNTTKRPGQMRIGSFQALARGANGIMFFQWRASKSGGEQFHGAMVPHAGTETRVFREVAQLGQELNSLHVLRRSRVHAQVAIVFDYASWWALEIEGKPSAHVRYLDGVRAFYSVLYDLNITVDFVHPEADLRRYQLVIAPHLYLVTDAAVDNITSYIEGGGALIMNFMSGIVDAHNRVQLGGYPAAFRSLLGISVEEFAPYAENQANAIITHDEEEWASSMWSDVIRLEGATPLARFRDDFYANCAAVTRHQFGMGTSYYLGTALDQSGMHWLITRVCAEIGLAPLATHAGAEIVCRSDDQHTWRFVQNHSSTPLAITLQPGEHELLGGQEHGVVTLAQYDVAIIAEATASHANG